MGFIGFIEFLIGCILLFVGALYFGWSAVFRYVLWRLNSRAGEWHLLNVTKENREEVAFWLTLAGLGAVLLVFGFFTLAWSA